MPTSQPAETRLGRLIRLGREAATYDAGGGVQKPMTQKALGQALGGLATNQSTVSAWEEGSVIPTIPYLLEICRALDLDPTALILAAEDDAAERRAAEQLADA